MDPLGYINGDGSKPWYLVNPKIAGKWMFIPLKMVLIGIDPYPNRKYRNKHHFCIGKSQEKPWICQIHPGGSAAPQVDPVVIATLQHLPGIRGALMGKNRVFMRF